MSGKIAIRLVAAAVVLAAIALTGGNGAGAAEFFKGKRLSLFAGYPPGGGVDSEMRLVARFYSKHLAGNPLIVAQNMPGASGLVLGNYMYSKAKPDGLTLGMPGRSSFLLANSIGHKGARYDLKKFSYVGSAISTNSILWLRKEIGIKNLAQLKKATKTIVLGGLSARSQNIVVPRVLTKYEGWPFRPIHGYPGFHAVLLAMERGEVDGLYSHEGSIQAARPDLITSGKIIPIFQTFAMEPNLPLLRDIITNPREKALLRLLSAPGRVGLPLLGPPGMAKDRLATLRTAYQKMARSKEYIAAAKKRGLNVTEPNSGPQIQAFIEKNLVKVSASVVKEYKEYTKRKKKRKKKKKK